MSACEHYQQQISQLLDGELPPEQVQTLRAHLRTCPECQRVYDGFLALQAAVRDAAAAPPADRAATTTSEDAGMVASMMSTICSAIPDPFR